MIGASFTYNSLVALCRNQLCEAEVSAALDAAVRASFLNQINDTHYRFNHTLMQETIYETLSFSQRQQWHTQIGDWLAGQPDTSLELAAYHYLRGDNAAKAAAFGCKAGDRAKQHGAYAGALEYYEQVLALSDVPPEMQQQAAEGRADVLALQGDYSAAITAYKRAIELGSSEAAVKQAVLSGDLEQLTQLEDSPTLRPWVAGSRAWLLAQQGDLDPALVLVQNALVEIDDRIARRALEALAQVLSSTQPVPTYDDWRAQFVNGTNSGN